MMRIKKPNRVMELKVVLTGNVNDVCNLMENGHPVLWTNVKDGEVSIYGDDILIGKMFENGDEDIYDEENGETFCEENDIHFDDFTYEMEMIGLKRNLFFQ